MATSDAAGKLRKQPSPEDDLKDIECPVCFNEMTIPVMNQCQMGHSVCQNCLLQLRTCPLCRTELMHAKNSRIERMIKKHRQVPCKFGEKGCKFLGSYGEIQAHEADCIHRTFPCPFLMAEKCTGSYTKHQIRYHITTFHGRKLEAYKPNSMQVHYLWNQDGNVRMWYKAILTLGQIFFFFSILTETYLYTDVFFVGKEEEAQQYKYRVALRRKGKTERYLLGITKYFHYDLKEFIEKRDCCFFLKEFVDSCVLPQMGNSIPQTLQIVEINHVFS